MSGFQLLMMFFSCEITFKMLTAQKARFGLLCNSKKDVSLGLRRTGLTRKTEGTGWFLCWYTPPLSLSYHDYKQDVQSLKTAPSTGRDQENPNISWAWPFKINSDPLHGTLHHATKFQAVMKFPNMSHFPGSSLSWKFQSSMEHAKIGRV